MFFSIKKSKKSQLFLFVIIGIIILVVFFLLFFLSYSFYKSSLQRNVLSSSYKENLLTIDTLMQNCLENSAKKGLLLIGRQSGYIYRSQGGLTPDDYNINDVPLFMDDVEVDGLKSRMAFWIFKSNFDVPPAYPSIGSFGFPVFPYLDQKSILLPVKKPITIEDNLEAFVLHDFEECFNISSLNLSFRNQLSLSGEPFVNVTFNKGNVRFLLHYPIRFYDKVIKDKAYTAKVDFKLLFEIAERAVINDIKNVSFSINSTLDKYGYPKNFVIEVFNGRYYDVVAVKDVSYKIGGKPFGLYFLRQNRPPVLKNLRVKGGDGNYCYGLSTNPIEVCSYDDAIDFSNCFVADPDEDKVLVLITSLQNGLTQVNKFKPNASLIGDFNYNISVVDSGGLSDWEIIKIKVKCCDPYCCIDEFTPIGPPYYCYPCKQEPYYNSDGVIVGTKQYYCSPDLICSWNIPEVEECGDPISFS